MINTHLMSTIETLPVTNTPATVFSSPVFSKFLVAFSIFIVSLLALPAYSQQYNAYTNASYSRVANDIKCLETIGYWQTCTIVGWLKRDAADNSVELFITGTPDEEGREIRLRPGQLRALPVGQFVRVQAKVRNQDNRLHMLVFYGV